MVNDSFAHRLNGRFDGMIRLTDVEKLRTVVATSDDWYLIFPDEELPRTPVSGQQASQHIETLVQEILREERGVWTTMIYVQSSEDPTIIKVFHPRRAGCGCGPSMNIRPWWVLSRIRPEEVPAWSTSGEETCVTPWWRKKIL